MSEPDEMEAARPEMVNQVSVDVKIEKDVEEQSTSHGNDEDAASVTTSDSSSNAPSDVSSEIADIADFKTWPVGLDSSAGHINRPLGLTRQWGFSSFDDYDVVTVHGLRNDHKTVWTSQTGKSWLRENLFQELSIRPLDYFYAVDEKADVFGPDGIEMEARNLLRSYREKRQILPDTEVNRPIIWICHDIGGNIVKKVLMEATQPVMRDDFEDIVAWESAKEIHHRIATLPTTIIFLGCPHKSESFEVLQDEMLNLMGFPGPKITNGRFDKIRNIARQVESINADFLRSKLIHHLTIINVYHLLDFPETKSVEEPTAGSAAMSNTTNDPNDGEGHVTGTDVTQIDELHQQMPAEDSIPVLKELPVMPSSPFSRYTLSTFINTMEKQNDFQLIHIDHSNLVRGDEYPADGDKWVKHVSRRFRENLYPLKLEPYLIQLSAPLLSVAPRLRAPTVHMEPRKEMMPPIMDWLTSQDVYQVLKNQSGPQLIHIEVNEEDSERVSILSQCLYTLYECEEEGYWSSDPAGKSFYFEFVMSDNRYNNIRSMLLAFVNHAVWHCSLEPSIYSRRILPQLKNYKSWSLTQLFRLFSTFRTWTNAANIAIILGSFDNCIEDERQWFLTAVQKDQSHGDIDYRVVITTRSSDDISKTFVDESQRLALGECPVPFLGYRIDEEGVGVHGLHVALEHLLQKRPVLNQVRRTVLALLDDCKNVPCHGYVILQWLDIFGRGAPLVTITDALEALSPVTAETILNEVLGTLGGKRRQWALQVHQWVRYAKEPLTPKALGQALALSTTEDETNISTALLDYDYQHLGDEIQKCFSGIVVIRDGEVKLSHDSFNQPISSTAKDSETEDSSHIHGSIAKACLQYMMQDSVQQGFERLSSGNYAGDELKYPLCVAGQDLLEYTVRFWVDHYRLAESHRPSELALSFFSTKRLRDRWAEAVYLLSNPFTRIQRSYYSPLPLMACFGLDDLVCSELYQARNSEWFQQDMWLAIVEAARNGRPTILDDLLIIAEADEASLKEAMFWAAAAKDQDIMIKILDKVKTLQTFGWSQSLLSCAAITGSEYLATAIAKSGFNLNQIDAETGQTALHAGIFWRQRAIVEILLQFEVDLSILDDEDMTPLELAVEVADLEIVQMLLDRGAKADQRTRGEELMTARAAEIGCHMILDLLISAGAQFQVDPSDTEMVEPVIHAAQKQRKECIRVLLKHGANPSAESRDGSLLYQFCISGDTVDICRLLLEKGANPNETYSDKEMLLIAGLRTDNTELVSLLIEHGAKINCIDPWEEGDGRTPLSFAAAECELEMIELLLDKGADIDYLPTGADAALFSTALRDYNTDRLEFFVKKGAKIDWRRDDGWQALHAAYDAPKSVKVLLKHGADVNAMCDSGTVTMMAARWGYKDTLEVLVANQESAPDLDAKLTYDPDHEDYGTTAIRLAAEAGHYHCASFLLESGARLDDEMKDAKFFITNAPEEMSTETIEACVKLIEQCVQEGTKANILDEEQNSVLHHLKKTTPVALVSTLIGVGAPIDNTNADGWTPLAIALKQRNIPAAWLLLSRGARADIYSPMFGNLLHIVCDWKRYEVPPRSIELYPLLKLLIRRKADPNMPGPEPEGELVLFTAIWRIPVHFVSEMIARYLIEEVQVDINFGGRAKTYPLVAAICKSYHHRLLNYLIQHKADLEVVDDQGLKPCHHAAKRRPMVHQNLELVTRSGIGLQARDCYDRTPLHFASTNSWHTVEMFIKRLPGDFDVDVRDSDGWTPLMWACRWGDSWETAQHLVQDYGADIWALSNDGQWSPLKLAYFEGFQEHLEGILQPTEDKMERVLENGSKQVWDTAFHRVLPGKLNLHKFCRNCIMPILGPLYICANCQEEFHLCFKCFPHRKKMHDPTHELKEHQEPESVEEEDDEPLDSGEGVDDDDDELEEDEDEDDEDDDIGEGDGDDDDEDD